ncbi:DUF2231 domain-containing protein [Nocardioides aquiterrae]|uniref:DUF2231 domain-containing protein n=1 Tax=Nocardioides aquiterrae TaxID=203799 RepID=A0ABP4EVA0_9ACTN
MEINGLPLHPLVVHAAVVLGPLAALAAILYAVLPGWRDGLRWPMVVLVLVATAAIWTAYYTGINFRGTKDFFNQPPVAAKIDQHARYANILRWVTTGLAVVAVAAAWLHARVGTIRIVLSSALVVAGTVTLAYVVLTGEAGARSVWGS